MADRSLVTTLAAGMRTKSNNMSLVTDPRSMFGPIRESFAGAWQRNVEIEANPGLASYSPIYACATRIASDVAKCCIDLKSDDGTGILDLAVKTSPYWPVLRKPNSYQNRIQFIRQWLLSKLLFGNTYVLKARDQRGIVIALYVLDPRSVHPLVTDDGGVYYSLSGNQLARIPTGVGAAPASEIIHDRGPTLWHPLVGVPPLYACALSGTLGRRIQQNSATFFTNMSRPSGMLSGPGTIDEITADRLKRDWEANYSHGNLGRLAVAGNGLEYTAMTIAAEQSQLVQQLGVTAVDVATAFGMPAYKINQGTMPTNNNVQALNQQYYNDCLQVPIEDIEACLNEGLSLPDGYSVEFDLDGLLRMDSLTQMEVLAKGVGGAILKPNEARKKLNLRPIKGGDTVYLQQQNFSLGALDERDESANPFEAAKPAAPAPDDQGLKSLTEKALILSERTGAAEESKRHAERLAESAESKELAAMLETECAKAKAEESASRLAELLAIHQKQIDDEMAFIELLSAVPKDFHEALHA